ncbi:hypothetical protein GALMADRAFT_217510 [Galerina marginata CBS 339.88]|uniref:Uncharacterized protein n=1 Tax=Galerina marginata (strain CBS 339.88) TaxID=685588 RepID=A0A067S6M3_GALM3|nr:hypothetical protein GALMADRAFT_217510 [Galerina marginata CBS 339.88]
MSLHSPQSSYSSPFSLPQWFSGISPRKSLLAEPPAGPGSASLPGLQFTIHPSYIIKSPLQRNPSLVFYNQATRLKLDRIDAEEYKAKAFITLAEMHIAKGAAEKNKGLKSLQEIRLLQQTVRQGADFTSLGPQAAVDLACATRDNLIAEERLIEVHITECEDTLQQLRDILSEAKARVQESRSQVGNVLTVLQRHNVNFALPPNLLQDYSNTDELSLFLTTHSRQNRSNPDGSTSDEDEMQSMTDDDNGGDVPDM